MSGRRSWITEERMLIADNNEGEEVIKGQNGHL
jgi:hypothetical protein